MHSPAVERVCGTCSYAHDRGDGVVACMHPDYRQWRNVTMECKRPRTWWKIKPELVPVKRAKAVQVKLEV